MFPPLKFTRFSDDHEQGAYPPPPQQQHDQYNNTYQQPHHDPYGAQQQYPPPHNAYSSPQPAYNNAVAVPPYPTEGERGHSPYPPQHGYEHGGSGGAYGHPQQQHGGQNTGYYGEGGAAPGGAAEGDRGLGATVLGSAGGAFLGHKMGGGALGTLGGMVAGAIGANVLENHHEK